MGIRFRKSIKVAPGVRVNVGKKGVGVSIGGKGFTKSINSSGRVTTSMSVPGTGISYVSTKNMNSDKSKTSAKHTAAPAATYSSTAPAAAPAAPLNCSRTVAGLLCIFLGYFGAHYFYARRWGMGLLYFCTVGLFGIGWLVDIFRIFAGHFRDKYGEII